MAFDLILKNARLAGGDDVTVDIGVQRGIIVAVEPSLGVEGLVEDADGRLVVPGFIETHIHLDKSCLLDRCRCNRGTLDEAVALVAAAKREFTEGDVYARASQTLEKSILHGTMRMRTHVEVDPRIGLTSLHALRQLRRDYDWAIDLTLCAFPQEGLIDDPGCEDVLIAALENGADLIGGAPYMDKDSHAHINRIFEIARRFDVDIDFHLDFGLDPAHLDITEVCRKTDEFGWGGRVTVGHVTKLSALSREQFDAVAKRLTNAGVAVTVLPSTDLYLTGRDHYQNVPRGVTSIHRLSEHGVNCSLSTNNVLNPFTPFGDCSMVRMANLYANVVQIGTVPEMTACMEMVTSNAARLMNLKDYGIAPGCAADFVIMDNISAANAIAEVSLPLTGFKAGKRIFSRPAPTLHRPS